VETLKSTLFKLAGKTGRR